MEEQEAANAEVGATGSQRKKNEGSGVNMGKERAVTRMAFDREDGEDPFEMLDAELACDREGEMREWDMQNRRHLDGLAGMLHGGLHEIDEEEEFGVGPLDQEMASLSKEVVAACAREPDKEGSGALDEGGEEWGGGNGNQTSIYIEGSEDCGDGGLERL